MFLYLFIWIAIAVLLSYEYFALSHALPSMLLLLQKYSIIPEGVSLTTEPGRPLSLLLGWLGLGLMIIMNVYSIRKRAEWMRNWGSLREWLNFHVFCGLLGPTFIFFHCNFKVRGIVAISFWSMVISFTSGIVGRYFYVQLLGEKQEVENLVAKILTKLDQVFEKYKIQVSDEIKQEALESALLYAGINKKISSNTSSLLVIITNTVVADIKNIFMNIKIDKTWPESSRYLLHRYAYAKRKLILIEPFKRVMGYWHAFHFPFAVFMYIAAFIHVVAAMIFAVK